MSYLNAKNVLPDNIIAIIQEYIDGDYLYIPKKEIHKKAWGDNTSTKFDLEKRNRKIGMDAHKGASTNEIAQKYFLSVKSVQRILRDERNKIDVTERRD